MITRIKPYQARLSSAYISFK